MKHPVSRELFLYWDRLRKGRAAPERADIDPAAIRGILSDTFIVSVEPESKRNSFPIRLSGTRLNALFLSDLKGRSLLDMWLEDDRAAVARIFDTVLSDTAPIVAGLRGGPKGHRGIDLEMVLLPLRHHGRTQARILGAIAPVEVPTWLGLVGIELLSLTSLRLIDPSLATAQPERRRAGERADHAPIGPGQRRYGRFVVHEGGR